jgi:A/G-specific adenine glycosylase
MGRTPPVLPKLCVFGITSIRRATITSGYFLPSVRNQEDQLRKTLLTWYGNSGRDLPWRKTQDPYVIWISEIMLQQTQVQTVLPYYERWLGALPTIQALAEAERETVLKLWEGLGYYTRARNLHRAAQKIVEEHSGRFPKVFDAVIALPGIGRSTAGAILSSAYGQPHAILDANVRRVISRLIALEETGSAAEKRLWEVSEALLDREFPFAFNQALMDLGATLCSPRNPQCLLCPWQSFCLGQQQPERFPVRPAKRARPKKQAFGFFVQSENGFLLVKRPEKGLLGGLWEFPTIENSEDWQIVFGSDPISLGTVEHAYTHFEIAVEIYWVQIDGKVEYQKLLDRWADRKTVWQPMDNWSNYALTGVAHKMWKRFQAFGNKEEVF